MKLFNLFIMLTMIKSIVLVVNGKMLSSQKEWKESTQEPRSTFVSFGENNVEESFGDKERKGRGLRFNKKGRHKNKSRSVTSTPTYTPTRSPSSKPTPRTRCEDWCKWVETPWRSRNASKCKWYKCAACDECIQVQVQECASWCKWNSTPWHSHTKAAKCKWNKCGSCQECSTQTHQHSSGKLIPRWECPENKEYIETFFEDNSDKPLWDCSCCPRY